MNSDHLVPTLFITWRQLNYGDSLYLTGSHPLLGHWSFENSIELRYGHQNIWSTIIPLPVNLKMEYKFLQSKSFKNDPLHIKWDVGFNHNFTVTQPKEDSNDLNIMSFNIRYENEIDGENSWIFRRQLAASIILTHMPDLLGTQESKPSQTQYLKEYLALSYDCYSRGRDFLDTDEAMTIYYKRSRFVLLDKGTFWLSEETPFWVSTKKLRFPKNLQLGETFR